MRLLLAELTPSRGALAANVGRIEEAVRAAGADIAVFPELFLSGYALGDRFHALALPPDGGPLVGRLSALARERRCAIVVGAPRRSAERPGEVENAVLLVRPDGTVGVQAKRYLPTFGPFDEGAIFTPTSVSRPVELEGRSVGLSICYDLFFPEVARELALAGASLLVVVSAAPVTSRRLFDRLLPARAIENALPVVYVNRVGVEDGLVFGGGSVAVDPRGEPLPSTPLDTGRREGERLLVVELDERSAERWRPFRPVLRDLSGGRPRPAGQLTEWRASPPI